MSNHYHIVVTDVYGLLPEFMRDLNSLLARSLNVSLGRRESFWASEKYCAPELLTENSVIEKSVYTLCNPVDAGLVSTAHAWGGATSASLNYGEQLTVPRPKGFFSSKMPKKQDLVLQRPAVLSSLSDIELETLVRQQCYLKEQEIGQRVRVAGGRFLGMPRVMRQKVTDNPQSRPERRGIKPHFAGRSRWAMLEALQRRDAFQREYRTAYEKLKAQRDKVVFPMGTFGLVARGIATSDTG